MTFIENLKSLTSIVPLYAIPSPSEQRLRNHQIKVLVGRLTDALFLPVVSYLLVVMITMNIVVVIGLFPVMVWWDWKCMVATHLALCYEFLEEYGVLYVGVSEPVTKSYIDSIHRNSIETTGSDEERWFE